MGKAAVKREMEAVAAHPSILAWLLVDEGDMRGWSPVRAKLMRDFVKSLYPSRPSGMVVRDCGSVNRNRPVEGS